ncbi:MAG: hypothetical protein JWQ68_209 [Cryobacterium sp.]|nr:hypothetical protein [Cryobacterium sp.]
MSTPPTASAGRLERILAYMVAGVVGLSILAFVTVIVATAAGVGANDAFSQGPWPFIITLPLFGLPAGFLLLIALMIASALRRSRDARQDRL